MTHLVLAENGKCNFRIDSAGTTGQIVRNAVSMFLGECKRIYGIAPEQDTVPKCVIKITSPVPCDGEDGQTFDIRTTYDARQASIIVSGTGERGILYGLCELLDQMTMDKASLVLPVLNIRSVPDRQS